jgi:1-acyl-sn-glycerol-3-phosphate acyltransferase
VLYSFLRLLVKACVFILIDIKVTGRDNVPKSGRLLVVSNHLSVGDPVLIGVFLGRKPHFMAKEEIFKNKMASYLLRYLGTFPVYRGASSRDALRKAIVILKEGKALGMFPEGSRSVQNELQSALPGTALIASHHHSPVLPIGFTGTENIRGFGWIWHRPRVIMTIGTVFYLPEHPHRLSRELLDKNSDIIMEHIAGLLPEKYQGKYAAKRNL